MFALQGLETVGFSEANNDACRRACVFLLAHQNPDGGWGEDIESVREKRYVQEPRGSQVTCTAYAVSGLIAARCSDRKAVQAGVAWLVRRQENTGEWKQKALKGIFATPGRMRYPNYKFHFTLGAL
ncbi:hypothetical protein E4U41_004263, partial [Claviceps citrina]